MPQESNGVGSIRNFLKILSEKSNNLPKKIKQQKISLIKYLLLKDLKIFLSENTEENDNL